MKNKEPGSIPVNPLTGVETTCSLVNWLVRWLLAGWLSGWLVGGSAGWLDGWLVSWLAGLAGRLG